MRRTVAVVTIDKAIPVSDISEQLGIPADETIMHIQALSELGIFNFGDTSDLSSVSSIKAGRISVAVSIEATLFGSATTKSDGKPKMESLPFYVAGYWYRANFGKDEKLLCVWKGGHGGSWSIAYEKEFADSGKALDGLTEYSDGLLASAQGDIKSLPYKGEECEIVVTPRSNEDEWDLADLMDAKGEKITTGTGANPAEAVSQLLAWHKNLGCELGEPPKPKVKRGAKA